MTTHTLDTLKAFLAELIACPSVSPEDKGTQALMISFLESLGFEIQSFDTGPVSNFFASIGTEGPLLVFAGHTDVVPTGPEEAWDTPPFSLQEHNGMLYGRGVADMKGSLAAMLIAAKNFLETYPSFTGRLGFLITSAEEGEDYLLGTPYVMEKLDAQGIKIAYCIVGEPTSIEKTGDMVKVGRRGSLSGNLTIIGKQGHVAYPTLALNPIHQIAPFLKDFTETIWDKGNTFFPPTSMQISSIKAGGEASNVIPGTLSLAFNFRYSTENTEEKLRTKVETLLNTHQLDYTLTWRLSGKPFLSTSPILEKALENAIFTVQGIKPELSTTGGTSDARFIAPYGVPVIELGPVNATIHQVNESLSVANFVALEKIYYTLMENLLTGEKS